ncbi:MAG UNVERIFIED_CONTAM: hypothetical protein LVQ98_03575 [Rickettsiaceae bacterium]
MGIIISDEYKDFDAQYLERKKNFTDHIETISKAKIYDPAKKELFAIFSS